ncbi:hypothetical protein SUDANB135_06056 [Streptomyces sp. SudanB135_2055]
MWGCRAGQRGVRGPCRACGGRLPGGARVLSPGRLVRLPEPAHRQPCGGPLAPVVPGAVEGPLGGVLALGRRPADVQAVDPHPVEAVGVRGVAGQAHQAGLGGDVRCQERLPAVRRRRDDVDDGAGRAPAHHVRDRRLHREERRPEVDRDVLVEQLGRGVQQRPPGRQPRRVDQAVDPAVRLHHPAHGRLRLPGVRQIGPHEHRLAARRPQLGDQGLARFRPPPGDGQDRPLPDGGPRDRGADALGAAVDQDDLSVEQTHRVPRLSLRRAPARSSARSTSGAHSSRNARRTTSAWEGGARPSTGGSLSRSVGNG